MRKFAGFAEKELKYDARLKRDDIGISAIPSVYLKEEEIMSIRERRQPAGKMRLDIFFGQCGLVVQTTL